jgi:hypothetical protein
MPTIARGIQEETNLMKFMGRFVLIFLISGVALGQSAPEDGSGKSVAEQLQTLQKTVEAQQAQMTEQQKQIEDLQRQLKDKQNTAPQVVNASMTTTSEPTVAVAQSDVEKPKESPLSFRIGAADFTPGGFVDFENVFRTTNSGSAISTNFGAIPFSNTAQGQLTEFRSTGQYSRFNLKVGSKFHDTDITGYLEGDFNGNDAASVFQTTNPHTLRLRLYWLDLKHGPWELLGGQSWGLQTPNRVGISAAPADLAITLNEDSNVGVGIPYSRASLFRLGWHPAKSFAWGVEVQNPQQFTNGEVVFPSAFATTLGKQFDPEGGANIPNWIPDIVSKIALDKAGDRHFHLEAGGMLTSVKIAFQNTPVTAASPFVTDSKLGSAVMGAFNFDTFKHVRVLANGIWGTGIARYLVGQGPNAVVVPVALTPTVFTATTSMVHAGATMIGLEVPWGKNTQFGAYYGGDYFQRNTFVDITSTAATQPFVGFGGPSSASNNNRAIQEGTLDIVHTFWRHPQYGSLVVINQASYLTRSPWFVAPGAPKNAHLFMNYLSLRYVLP